MNAKLSSRETATLLAALRYWQREGLMSGGDEWDIATDHGRFEALSAQEIDQLCTRLSPRQSEQPSDSTLFSVGSATCTDEPLPFQILVEDGNVVGVRALRAGAAPGRRFLFTVREYESDGSLDADHRTGLDEEGRAYYEHAVELLEDALGAGPRADRHNGSVNIDLSVLEWEDISLDTGLPRSRLLATVQFGGVHHHLEAIEVRSGASRFDQQATCAQCEQILERYSAVDADAGPFSTMEWDDRRYALFMMPFRY